MVGVWYRPLIVVEVQENTSPQYWQSFGRHSKAKQAQDNIYKWNYKPLELLHIFSAENQKLAPNQQVLGSLSYSYLKHNIPVLFLVSRTGNRFKW